MLPGELWLLEIQVTYESTRSVQLKGAGSNAVSSNRSCVSWMEMGEEAFQRFPLWMKLEKSPICFKLSRTYYILTFKCNNNIRRLSKLPCNS